MNVYTRRLQTMLTEEQYAALEKIAIESHRPISVLIREAIEKTYLDQSRRACRRAALKRLVAMQAPVDEWEKIEAEIARGMLQ
jgi:predicted transcriptional regulator